MPIDNPKNQGIGLGQKVGSDPTARTLSIAAETKNQRNGASV
jgi:hypothetical protein